MQIFSNFSKQLFLERKRIRNNRKTRLQLTKVSDKGFTTKKGTQHINKKHTNQQKTHTQKINKNTNKQKKIQTNKKTAQTQKINYKQINTPSHNKTNT